MRLSKGLVATVLIFLLAAGMNFVFAAKWELVYTADTLPDDKSLGKNAWECGKAGQWEGKREFTQVNPPGELHIKDPSDAGSDYVWYARWFEEQADAEHTTLEARVKSLQNTDGNAVCMSIDNQVGLARLFAFPDGVEIWEGGKKHSVDMKEYRILRITREGQNVKAYVDGKEVLSGAPKSYNWDFSRVVFGALSSTGIGEAYWDYIAYTTEGAFSPAELSEPLAVGKGERKLTSTWSIIKNQR